MKPAIITSAPVSSALPGCFSMLKFLKCSQAFYRQKIFLPGMAGTVRVEQTHKTFFDCRIEVVVQKVFPVRQIQLFHHSLDRIRIIADRQYELLTGGIFRNQLVGYLWGTCGVSLWGELFRSGNNQITVLQLVGFAQQEVAEELLQMFKFRLNAAGIVAIVGTDKGIAEVPGVFSEEIVADGESHCPEIFDRKDSGGAGVALPEGVDLPDAGNELAKVPDHLCVIEVLVAELCE